MNRYLERESVIENTVRLFIFFSALAIWVANRNALPDASLSEVKVPSTVFLQEDTSPMAYLFPDLIVMYAGNLPVKVVCPNGVVLKPKMVVFASLNPRDKLDYTNGLESEGNDFLKDHDSVQIANVGSVPDAGCWPLVVRTAP